MLKQRLIRLIMLFNLGLMMVLGISVLSSLLPQTRSLTIAAGQNTGDSYQLAEKIAAVVQLHQPSIKISVEATDGTPKNLQLLDQGTAQLAMAQADIPTPRSAQVVSLMFPDLYQLVVKSDLGVTRISQLKGKRVKFFKPPEKGGQLQSLEFLLNYYHLQKGSDYDYITAAIGPEEQAFCSGRVNAIFYVRAAGNEWVKDVLKEGCRGRLIAIDQAKAMQIERPNLEVADIPQGAYQGNPPIPERDLPTVGVQRLLLARQDVDKEVIQKITQVLYEHRQDLLQSVEVPALPRDRLKYSDALKRPMPLAAYISQPNFAGQHEATRRATGIPTHAGAQAYYDREKPSPLEQYADVFSFLLSMMTLGIAWGLNVLRKLEQRQKDKADDYIREVVVLMDAADCLKALGEFLTATAEPNEPRLHQAYTLVVENTAKVLVECRKSEQTRQNQRISQESLASFNRTFHQVVSAIAPIAHQKQFNIQVDVLKTATVLMSQQAHRPSLSVGFLPSLRRWLERLGLWSRPNGFPQKQLETDLNTAFATAFARFPSLEACPKLSDFWDGIGQDIRQDLDLILKRAVKALVEERISQESFQSFRVVWQIAQTELEKAG
jgi:TRAP transporter TAXI family solute receptor